MNYSFVKSSKSVPKWKIPIEIFVEEKATGEKKVEDGSEESLENSDSNYPSSPCYWKRWTKALLHCCLSGGSPTDGMDWTLTRGDHMRNIKCRRF
jgi:hypothetical protein